MKAEYIILVLVFELGLLTTRFAERPVETASDPVGVTDTLYNEIARLDSLVFDAFNKRAVVRFDEMFTKDLEFYHDKTGLTGYDHMLEFMQSTAAGNTDLRRDLVKESLEVYPIPGYGAMEIGAHRFCHTENGKPDCGTFRFVHIWKKEPGGWKIARVVSYGH